MIRLAVRVDAAHAEIALAELLELASAGVEQVDRDDGTVEYAVYGAPGELPSLPDLSALAGDALVQVSTSELPDDWSERWKQFHRPVLVHGPPDLYVRPPWEPPACAAGNAGSALDIVIDPAQAFGTGAHATTRLCLTLLLELARERRSGPLLDIGAGSGVLAIAAARLGFAPVLALDHDPESVAAATHNAGVNGVALDVRRFDLRGQSPPWPAGGPSATVVLANLLRPLLLDLLDALAATPTQRAGAPDRPDRRSRSDEAAAAPAHLIVSGLLTGEVEGVCAAYVERLGMRERRRVTQGEWGAAWLSAARSPRPAQIPSGTSVAARTSER